MTNSLEKKMYSLNLYQLKGIQTGIQNTHSVCRYVRENWKDDDLQDWLFNWETIIVLDGGSTLTLTKYLELLKSFNIKCEAFYESDLGDIITSIAFLLDEESFNIKDSVILNIFRKYNIFQFESMLINEFQLDTLFETEALVNLCNLIGTKKVFLKFFTSKFKSASN